eukprot:281288_1
MFRTLALVLFTLTVVKAPGEVPGVHYGNYGKTVDVAKIYKDNADHTRVYSEETTKYHYSARDISDHWKEYYQIWFNMRFMRGNYGTIADRWGVTEYDREPFDPTGWDQWLQDNFQKWMKDGVYQLQGAEHSKEKKGWETDDKGGCADADPDKAFACAMCEWLCANVKDLFSQKWIDQNC